MTRQTNTARRRAHEDSARNRAANLRAEQARRERRRRLLIVGGSALGVLAIVAVIVIAGVSSSGSKTGSSARTPAPASLVSAVTGVPSTTLDSIGKGTISAPPKAVKATPLTAAGKPQIVFIGAEFCPYCAAERWAIVQALSRFGTFSGLSTTRSSDTDVFPGTATFSFHGASFTSATVALTADEVETRTGAPLDTPSAADTTLWQTYIGKPGSFPFLDIAGRYVVTAPSFDPGVLKGLTAQQIAAQLADPSSKVAQAVDGTANVLTAAICKATNGTPSTVCSAAGVTAAGTALSG